MVIFKNLFSFKNLNVYVLVIENKILIFEWLIFYRFKNRENKIKEIKVVIIFLFVV